MKALARANRAKIKRERKKIDTWAAGKHIEFNVNLERNTGERTAAIDVCNKYEALKRHRIWVSVLQADARFANAAVINSARMRNGPLIRSFHLLSCRGLQSARSPCATHGQNFFFIELLDVWLLSFRDCWKVQRNMATWGSSILFCWCWWRWAETKGFDEWIWFPEFNYDSQVNPIGRQVNRAYYNLENGSLLDVPINFNKWN